MAKQPKVTKIHLNTAAARVTPTGIVRAEAGEELIVGQEITAKKAAQMVAAGGAEVVGGGTIDVTDHDGDGEMGGAASMHGASTITATDGVDTVTGDGTGEALPPITDPAQA